MLTGNNLAKFREALFEHSDVIDGPREPKPPTFLPGMNLTQFMFRTKQFEDDQAARDGKWIFTEWRQRWANCCAEYIRLYFKAKVRASVVEFPSIREANAVYFLLSFGSEPDQDAFLRGDEEFKNAIIAGLLADGGLYDGENRWIELGLL